MLLLKKHIHGILLAELSFTPVSEITNYMGVLYDRKFFFLSKCSKIGLYMFAEDILR